jgi:mono/diheme cytochrome c family protein
MKTRALLAALPFCALSSAAQAAAPGDGPEQSLQHGKALHAKHCTGCHDSSVYTRPDRKMDSLDALKDRVELCENAAGVTRLWTKEDVSDVVAFLNANFYKFDTHATQTGATQTGESHAGDNKTGTGK